MRVTQVVPARYALEAEVHDGQRKEERLVRIIELEDRIFERASGVVEAALSFHEVTPFQEEPPADWIAQYGLEGAKQRLGVAKSGWMPQTMAPSAVKLAVQTMIGIARGRGYRVQVSQNTLNVKIELPAPTSAQHPMGEAYPVKEIDQ